MKKAKLPLRVMIGIPVHNRRGYVRFTALALCELTLVRPENIYVFDDNQHAVPLEGAVCRVWAVWAAVLATQRCLSLLFSITIFDDQQKQT